MERYLKAYSDHIFAAMRIVAGFLFFCHGLQKLFGLLGGDAVDLGLIWVAGLIELVGGGLICVGFFAGWAAFICSGQMAAAYFIAHQPNGLLPIMNRGELAALYSFVFLFIASRGSGRFSVDARFGRG